MRTLKIILASVIAFTTLTTIASAEVNKYNEMDFINHPNRTLAEIAEYEKITVDEFKTKYNLPEDMPADTNEAAVFYNMTVESVAKMYGKTTEDFVNDLKQGIVTDLQVDKDTLYDAAYGALSIKHHLGGYSFDEFKEAYQLPEHITEDSTLGEIRNIVSRKILAFSGKLSYFASGDLLIMAKGKYLDFDVAPTIINERTMVPMRAIFEYFNAKVEWIKETQTIIAKRGDDIITMQIGQNFFFLNDQKIEIDSPPVIVEGRTLVPVRAISESLKREVRYNQNTRTVIIH